MAERTRIFIGYSNQDRGWSQHLFYDLRPLIRNHTLDFWEESRIDAGGLWKEELQTALSETRVAVLLVSAAFLASDLMAEDALPPLLRAAASDGVTILWIPVSLCRYQDSVFVDFPSLLPPKKPLDSLSRPQYVQTLRTIAYRIRDVALIPQPQSGRNVALLKAPKSIAEYVDQMVPLPGGMFSMGSDTSRREDEHPIHSVTLSAFRLGRTPVTVAMWREYCKATKRKIAASPFWGWIDDHPMVRVSWSDIAGVDGKDGYCAWASTVTGIPLSLPTEAQWEFAARGMEGREYPWGSEFDTSKLWCSTEQLQDAISTAPVTNRERLFSTAEGVLDLSSNVSEWCWDWYDQHFYETREATHPDPTGPKTGTFRVFRGGSWYFIRPSPFRGAFRQGSLPSTRSNTLGFRLCARP